MNKKYTVVMLSTNQKANLYLASKLVLTFVRESIDGESANQHLYILSNEEIQEGDWVYNENIGIFQILSDSEPISDCKKVIASTSSLKIRDSFKVSSLESTYSNLPTISRDFIEEYVKEFNKGNQITEVMVEYEEILTDKILTSHTTGTEYYERKKVLKLNNQNEISISKVETKMYSRKEVIELCKSSYEAGSNHSDGIYSPIDLNDWIKENL